VHTVCKYGVLHPKFVRHNLKCYCRSNISYTNKLTSKFVGMCSAFARNCSSSSVVTVKRNTKYAVALCGCDNSGRVSVLRTHLIMEVNLRLLRNLLKHECVLFQVQQIHLQADRRCLVLATLWSWRGAARPMTEDAWLQVTAWKWGGCRTRTGRLWQTGRWKVLEDGKRRKRVWTCFLTCTQVIWFCGGDYPYRQCLFYLTIFICHLPPLLRCPCGRSTRWATWQW